MVMWLIRSSLPYLRVSKCHVIREMVPLATNKLPYTLEQYKFVRIFLNFFLQNITIDTCTDI